MARSSLFRRGRSHFRRRVLLEALERRELLASYSTPEDTQLVVTDEAFVHATLVSPPLHGTLSFTNAGGFAYKPNLNYHGPDRFIFARVTATGTLNTPGATTEVPITVTPVNDAPEARADEYHTPRNTTLTVAAPGVLKNDKDVDNNDLKAKVVTQPANGMLVLNENGGFTYAPKADFVGVDSFTYVASDGSAESNEAKVWIAVKALPDARDDQVSVLQNASTTIATSALLANDVPVTNFGLIASLEPGDENIPKHGTVRTDDNGNFVYTPATGYFGPDSFVYRATDATPFGNPLPPAFDLARVWIFVRPVQSVVVANDDAYSTIVGKPLEIANPGVLMNDYVLFASPTGSAPSNTPGTVLNPFPLTAKLVEGSGPQHGTVTLKPEGGFVYVSKPNENYVGLDSFTYTASLATTAAGGTSNGAVLSDTAVVTIEIKPFPLPVAVDDFYSVLEGRKLEVGAPGVLGNDRRVENRVLVADLERDVENGTLDLKADGSFEYTPNAGFSGYDSFTYYALHENSAPGPSPGTASGILPDRPINLGTVRIYVQEATPSVYARDDFYDVLAAGVLRIEPPGVLRNDSLIPQPAILTPLAGATTANTNLPGTTNPWPYRIEFRAEPIGELPAGLEFRPNGSFTYDPPENVAAEISFQYKAFATVTPGGDDPAGDAATSAASSIAMIAPCTLNQDGTAVCPPSPDLDNIGTVTIRVRQPQPPPGPVARDDSFLTAANTTLEVRAPGVLKNDFFFSLDPVPATNESPSIHRPLFAVVLERPEHGTVTLNLDGSFKYVPDANFRGIDKFTYRAVLEPPATDGNATTSNSANGILPDLDNIATVTIRVVPAVAYGDSYSTPQDTELNVEAPGVLKNDEGGSESRPLVATLLRGPLHGTLELQSDGSFVYVPNEGYAGPDIFTYRAGDGSVVGDPTTPGIPTTSSPTTVIPPLTNNAIDVGVVRIYVRPKTPEVKANEDKYTARENTTLSIAAPGVLANDLRPANVPLLATIVERPEKGTLELKADGGFTYVPEPDFVGTVKFSYRASLATATGTAASNSAGGSIATVTIYVLGEDQLPRFIPGGDQATTDESGQQKIADWATLVSIGSDGRPAAFVITTDKPQLFAQMPAIDATGQLAYTPAPNVSGTARVTVSIDDDFSSSASFDIRVDKPNPLHNVIEPCDVNGDFHVVAGDALDLINYLNARGSTSADMPEGEAGAVMYYDVDKDGVIAAADALDVINFLNAGMNDEAEGEHAAATDLSLLALTAEDSGGSNQRRRRST